MGCTVLKIIGSLLLLFITKIIAVSAFGNLIAFVTDNFYVFIFLGLIPALIAKFKNDSFYLWWIFGTWIPGLSIIAALLMDDSASRLSRQKETSN
ncbi:hypothetical protein HA075_08535 [bacterium BFN5]|nr:hypothetical protein HA075_08350 [bacterium BFN5]QJW45894.1 hypothetical protein HA075_08535 [bacterium BFN5]